MADKRIIELEERLTLSDGDYLATDNTNGTCKVNAKILLDRLSDNEDAIATKAAKVDLTNISITGSTNNTGSTIASGSFFYKDGTLVRAKTDIANNATLTLNTNYEIVTAGGLNALNNALSEVELWTTTETSISSKTITVDLTGIKRIAFDMEMFGRRELIMCKVEGQSAIELSHASGATGVYVINYSRMVTFTNGLTLDNPSQQMVIQTCNQYNALNGTTAVSQVPDRFVPKAIYGYRY